MQLLEFRKDFIETVKSLAVTEGDFEQSSFVNLCAGKLEEAEEFEDFDPCYYEGSGRRNRRLLVHGFAFDDVDESVNLLVAQYSGTDEMNTLTYTDLGKLFDRLRAFTEEAVSGRLHVCVDESSPCFGLAYQLFQRRAEISRFKFYRINTLSLDIAPVF